MDTDPYRYHDERYYTSDANNNSASDPDAAAARTANGAQRSVSKPMMWSLAAAGGLAALSLMWASKRHKPHQTRPA